VVDVTSARRSKMGKASLGLITVSLAVLIALFLYTAFM
jgi:hypothetical protein